jgi:hypothetical protein
MQKNQSRNFTGEEHGPAYIQLPWQLRIRWKLQWLLSRVGLAKWPPKLWLCERPAIAVYNGNCIDKISLWQNKP